MHNRQKNDSRQKPPLNPILKTCEMIDNPQPGIWELTEPGARQQRLEAAEIKKLYYQRLDERRQRGNG